MRDDDREQAAAQVDSAARPSEPGVSGMPGMTMHQMSGGQSSGSGAMPALIPGWLGILAAVVFLGIALSHLRHLAHTSGQRWPWHACHVLMAAGMAVMYAPAAIDPVPTAPSLWRVIYAATGLLAAAWSLGDSARAPKLVWLLTAIDLGAMFAMWSSPRAGDPLVWAFAAYLTFESADAYRVFDRQAEFALISWRALPAGPDAPAPVTAPQARASSRSMLGDVDIRVSMVLMTLGMAYMLVAMQLT